MWRNYHLPKYPELTPLSFLRIINLQRVINDCSQDDSLVKEFFFNA